MVRSPAEGLRDGVHPRRRRDGEPHVVTDRSGWTLRAGSLYTGGTPHNQKNQGGMVSDGGGVFTGGMALRIDGYEGTSPVGRYP